MSQPDRPPKTQLPPTLGTDQVAALFRVDPKTVQRWGNQSKLPYTLNGCRVRRYSREDVLRLLDECIIPKQGD